MNPSPACRTRSVGHQIKARAILGLPNTDLVCFLVGVGYPAGQPRRPITKPDRPPFDEVVHRGQW
jgi:hypothetical protein